MTAKLLIANKVDGLRRVYVSWRLDRPPALAWKDEFWLRLTADVGQLSWCFAECLQSGDAESGSLLQAWFKSKLAAGKRNPVTDVVAVLSSEYIAANTDKQQGGSDGQVLLAEGELALFFDHIISTDLVDPKLRIFLAPLDKPSWKIYAVRQLRLQDAGTKHRWMVRLREDRFKWPHEDPAACSDQVADAVALITD